MCILPSFYFPAFPALRCDVHPYNMHFVFPSCAVHERKAKQDRNWFLFWTHSTYTYTYYSYYHYYSLSFYSSRSYCSYSLYSRTKPLRAL